MKGEVAYFYFLQVMLGFSLYLENRLQVKREKISDDVAPIDESVLKECVRACDPSRRKTLGSPYFSL